MAIEPTASVLSVYCKLRLSPLPATSRFNVPVDKLHGDGIIDESLNAASALHESFEAVEVYFDAPGRSGSDLFKRNLLAITTWQ
jgi:hypothetical protein